MSLFNSCDFAKRGREPSIREKYAEHRAAKLLKNFEKHFDDKNVMRQHDCGLRMRTCPSTNMLVIDPVSSVQQHWKCFNCNVIFDNDDEYFIMALSSSSNAERLISVCGYCYDIPAVRKLATTPLSLKHFCDGCGRFNRVEGFKHSSYCIEFDEGVVLDNTHDSQLELGVVLDNTEDAYDAAEDAYGVVSDNTQLELAEDAYLLHRCPEGTSIHRGLYYENSFFKCMRCDVVM